MGEMNWSQLLRPELAEFSAYVPVAGNFPVRLDANEAPSLMSDDARRRMTEVVAGIAWERYPDASYEALRAALADYSGVSPQEILAGVGSDELISILLTSLARPRGRDQVPSLVTTTPSFVMYRMTGRLRGTRVVEVPLGPAWELPLASMKTAVEMASPNILFIASPNNPTGNLMAPDALAELIEAAPSSLVIVDEAYVPYAERNQLELYRRYPNVAILRTLSKVGFASLRVGWLIAHPQLVVELDKMRLPYNLPTVSQRLATVAVTELRGELESVIGAVRAERARLGEALGRLPGVSVAPSQANFLWVKLPMDAGKAFDGLCARGVLVRSFHGKGGRLANYLRVTVGSAAENDRFLQALSEVLG